ncbi:MAG TPA: sugar phosphate nucleotidyltransferase [Bacilli bacterium]|nr:sugar phosphate nucleotidyltransferase [Bacilli bacterium]
MKYAIILAAGKGTRMETDLPKCAYPINGTPMVEYIVNSCRKSGINKILVVVGHKKEHIQKIFNGSVEYVLQEQQLGTANAVMCTKSILAEKEGFCLIFPGDMPLINEDIITKLVNYHSDNKNDLTIVTTKIDIPDGYGRIYREDGKIKKIVEALDATPEILAINEINSGVYCVDIKLLFSALDKVKNNNRKKEYYLTDIVEILCDDYKVDTFVVADSNYLLGINDVSTAQKVEAILKTRSGF